MHAGLTIAAKAPCRAKDTVRPQPFTVGSRALFDETIAMVDAQLSKVHGKVGDNWKEWEQKYIPKNDDASDYISKYVTVDFFVGI